MSALERVLFVSSDDPYAPSDKQFVGFSQELLARGHAVMYSHEGDPASAAHEGVDRIAGLQRQRHVWRGPRLAREHVDAVVRFRPDVVHALNSRVATLPAARAFARAAGAQLFVHFADDEWVMPDPRPGEPLQHRLRLRLGRHAWPLHPPLWWFSTARTLRWTRREAAGLDAITPVLGREVHERLGRECSVVLPVTPELPAAPGARDDGFDLGGDPVLLFTGSVYYEYLPDYLLALRAVGELHRRGRRVTFVHAGRLFDLLDPDALLADVGVPRESVKLLGLLPFHRMAPLMQAATILLQPGPPNRFNRLRLPSKLQSYLASGVPTITFSVGFGEMLEDRVEVLKTYGDSASELADRVEELLDDPGLYARVGEAGRAAAARLFDRSANTDALLRSYRSPL